MGFTSRYRKYKKPLWLTEFACDGEERKGPAGQLEFLKEVIPELERDADVYRYAWFGYDSLNSAALVKGGKLTELGEAYFAIPGVTKETTTQPQTTMPPTQPATTKPPTQPATSSVATSSAATTGGSTAPAVSAAASAAAAAAASEASTRPPASSGTTTEAGITSDDKTGMGAANTGSLPRQPLGRPFLLGLFCPVLSKQRCVLVICLLRASKNKRETRSC